MAVHHRARVEVAVPTLRSTGPAPWREAGDPRQHGLLFFKREVIDQDLGKVRRIGLQPRNRILASGGAPGFPIRKRVGPQDQFVRANRAAFTGPPNYVLALDVPGPKTVVVEQKQRHNQNRSAAMFNHWVRVFGSENVVEAGDLNEPLVQSDATKPGRRIGTCPEFVVSGNPDDLLELGSQVSKTPVKSMRAGGNVPSQDQPVVGKGRKTFKGRLVLRMGHMQVRQRP